MGLKMKPDNTYINRVIIAGGRDVIITRSLLDKIGKILVKLDPPSVELVTGTAKGADQIAYQFPHYPLKEFPANWKDMSEPCVVRSNSKGTFNALAGNKRNLQMAEYATHLIAIWDGKSTGTKDMISLAKKLGLKRIIINY